MKKEKKHLLRENQNFGIKNSEYMIKLKLEVEINTKIQDQLNKLCQLIKEGWIITEIDEPEKDRANKDIKFVLIRE